MGYAFDRVTKEENELRYFPFLVFNHQLVDQIDANSGAEDAIFIWGNWPVAYWWADRPLVSRFVYDTGLRARWSPEVWRRELVDDLGARPPRYIVISLDGSQPWLVGTNETPEGYLARYPAFTSFISGNYDRVWENPLFWLYEHR